MSVAGGGSVDAPVAGDGRAPGVGVPVGGVPGVDLAVEALRIIGNTLKKKTWTFSVNPCDVASNVGGWINPNPVEGSEDAVTCDCSFLNGTVCHVTSILLKTQDLQGSLPKEFVGLPYLQEINLARNYLNGSIPPEWGVLPLVNLTLLGNRLSGPIPKEIGNISTLRSLALEYNQLSGILPQELGNLSNLQRLFLSSNNFSGDIPTTFGKLTNLTDFRISDNSLTGTIPDFIGNWTELESLVSHASGLAGPIPVSIAGLTNLEKLRISDLPGPGSPIAPLQNISKMKTLDLTFNQLSGPIPSTYTELRDIFDGEYVKWANPKLDDFYGLHINCGGDEVIINGTKYNADTYDRAPHFFESTINGWVSSNTGNFIDDHRVPGGSGNIWNNTSELKMIDPQLYAQARLSAVSLTYYAMCIVNGDYNVNLHFAEIMLKDGQTCKSLGRRIFDIYIQGKLMVKDFNIVEEAGGVGKVVIKTIPVTITDGKLEIRLSWAGKGTIAIPDKGVYGPLISAISVDPGSGLDFGVLFKRNIDT
ncbi:PREDICTED: probable leucine-rich repeat receptor-like serine/threonine-protein kinase At3g14840 [Camelina sativa]|uniref:non-specific serine/threonine protein kinase n=1 Tax=Camelina sativa TaxID=90675 RepID=A0ABM1QHM8_CAMSA|nr:PREDICTED: probable leucine-rich repeat receptor-like serine/threonine-protein kinase At3g14840 [Camelina sativa]